MRSAAVPHAEVACGEMQWIAGKNVSRPRSSAARQNDGVNSLATIKGNLRADERSISRCAVRIVAAGHVDFDIGEAMFSKMTFQRGESLVSFHIRHEAQIEFGDGA